MVMCICNGQMREVRRVGLKGLNITKVNALRLEVNELKGKVNVAKENNSTICKCPYNNYVATCMQNILCSYCLVMCVRHSPCCAMLSLL